MAIAQAAALFVVLAAIAIESWPLRTPASLLATSGIVAAMGVLRSASVDRRLASSTLALDAIAMVVILASTGATVSPFYVMALAGTWWAANVPRPRSGLVYGLAFAAAYAVLVVPQAIHSHTLTEALETPIMLLVVAVLADRFVLVDRRALELNDALSAPFAHHPVPVREGLTRALGGLEIPIDVILTAGRMGLTAIQAELLSYLVMGLSNLEIADAIGLSESGVRYRLTQLYRAMGVHGRREAAGRAHEVGLKKAS